MVEGIGSLEARTLLKLIPDSAERHFGPPQLNCSPLVIFFEVFPDMFFSTSLA
jgi:hypothetical protein